MALRTRLVVAMLLFTFFLTVTLSLAFLSQLLREQIAQTEAANNVLAREIITFTAGGTTNATLRQTLQLIVHDSTQVQDAFVTGADDRVIDSSNLAMIGKPAPQRRSFHQAGQGSFTDMQRLIFGQPQTLDLSLAAPAHLTAHIGLRSTLLRNAYEPWLRNAALLCLFSLLASLVVAGTLATAAMRPIEQVARELEDISLGSLNPPAAANAPVARQRDAVMRVARTISRIEDQLRTSQQVSAQAAISLSGMLHTLKDGIMLVSADLRVTQASTAAAMFLPQNEIAQGQPIGKLFPPSTPIGSVLAGAFAERQTLQGVTVHLEDGRSVLLNLDHLPGSGAGSVLTLRDARERETDRPTLWDANAAQTPLAGEPRLQMSFESFGHADVQRAQEQELLPVVQAVMRVMSAEAERRNIAIAITSDSPKTQVRVVANADLLAQALVDLAQHAMQSMPQGGVLHWNVGRDRHFGCLSLYNTGGSLPRAALHELLQGDPATEPVARANRAIQRQGGSLELAPGGNAETGTLLMVRLPLIARVHPADV